MRAARRREGTLSTCSTDHPHKPVCPSNLRGVLEVSSFASLRRQYLFDDHRSHPHTAKMADAQVTLRTRKFIRNPLLARKQMVV